ncbi:cytochrome P450 [Zopfochytrium polystomum]|nr:cytochrome P450 [Zopfochytrium polystomum]
MPVVIPAPSSSWAALTLRVALALGVPAWLAYILYIRPFRSPLRKLPGPPPTNWWSLLGKFPEILRQEAGVPQLQWAKQYGGMVLYYGLFNTPRVLVTSPTALRRIYGTHAHLYTRSAQQTKALKEFTGNGLLTAEGDQHKRQRALINPSFRVKHIAAMTPLFADSADELVRAWIDLIEGGAALDDQGVKSLNLDVHREAAKVTLDIIGRAGFGYDFTAVQNKKSPLYESFQTILRYNSPTVPNIVRTLLPFLAYIPTEGQREYKKARAVLRSCVEDIIESRYQNLASKDGDSDTDLLSILIRANEESDDKISKDEIEGQVLTFLIAGHETTSVSLTWTLHLLSEHPQIQSRLRAEIDSLLPRNPPFSSSELTFDQVHSLPLLDAVVKETLRLIPPVPLNGRQAAQDDVLDGFFIPRGTMVFTPPLVMHRLPAYWGEDADQFVPDRWMGGGKAAGAGGAETADNAAAVSSAEGAASGAKAFGAYMPFLLGPRNCIGARFALTELKVLLVLLLREFEFKPVPGFKFQKKLEVTWKPQPSLLLNVRRRAN